MFVCVGLAEDGNVAADATGASRAAVGGGGGGRGGGRGMRAC